MQSRQRMSCSAYGRVAAQAKGPGADPIGPPSSPAWTGPRSSRTTIWFTRGRRGTAMRMPWAESLFNLLKRERIRRRGLPLTR